ncbi:response regulator [uncultured Brevundimonas sp.]|uniref:response regulator transcription factor n=1 Tax=uncultured Brevundimonas sp. TaxID=213418 RepID=UPI0030ECF13A|tara:strand:- start:19858 stop:20250 length:393 start_codon:yes stop_codon:yes gene_type:complete
MLKCIVVEDDHFWSEEINDALVGANVEVVRVANGREAIEMARRYPDAGMILDIILPDVDGVQVLQQLRHVVPDMPVLAVTGGGRLGAEFYLKLARTFGAQGQLAKPFTPAQLVDSWMALAAGAGCLEPKA